MNIQISASILGCDISKFGDEIKKAVSGGVDMIHFDVMDGMFVNNISFGIPVLESLKKTTDVPFDVHLMIEEPIRYIKNFIDAGADIVTVHLEACSSVEKTLAFIKENGAKAGLTIKPNTPVDSLYPYLEMVDMVLIMTVEPGFGGQGFLHQTLDKVAAVKSKIVELGLDIDIQVDGGVSDKTAELVKKAGANNLVSGSYLFNQDDIKTAVDILKSPIK